MDLGFRILEAEKTLIATQILRDVSVPSKDSIMVSDKSKTKGQLIAELEEMRQQLEEQNRHLETEQILERVLSQALGMHQSGDLTAVAATVFGELRALDIDVWRCGFGIPNDQCDPPQLEAWFTTAEGDAIRTGGTYTMDEDAHGLMKELYMAWKRGDEHFSVDVRGDELKGIIDHLIEERGFSLPEWGERHQEDLPECCASDGIGIFPHFC